MNTQTQIKCTKSYGFSLIELMVVIAIVGVLAAVAIPSYKNYNSKARFTEAQALIGRQMDAYAERLTMGQSNASLTLPTPTGMTSLVTNSAGTPQIVATWPASAIDVNQNGTIIATYTPVENTTNGANTITWTCAITGTTTNVSTTFYRNAIRDTYFTNPQCT